MTAQTARKRILTPRRALATTLATCAVAGAAFMGAAAPATASAPTATYQGSITKVGTDGVGLEGAVFEVEFRIIDNHFTYPGASNVSIDYPLPDLSDFDLMEPDWDTYVARQIERSQIDHDATAARHAPLLAELAELPTVEDVAAAEADLDAWKDVNGVDALEDTAATATATHEALVAEHAELDAIPAGERTQEQSDRLAVLMTELPIATQEMHAANAAVTAAFDANDGEGSALRTAASDAANGFAQRAPIQAEIAALPPIPEVITADQVSRDRFEATFPAYDNWNGMVSNAHHQAAENLDAGLSTAPVEIETDGDFNVLTYELVSDENGNVYFPLGANMVPSAITEVAAPDGYVLDSTRHEVVRDRAFDIEVNGQASQVIGDQTTHIASFVNAPIEEEPPAPPVEEPPAPPVEPEEPTKPEAPVQSKPAGKLAYTGSDSTAPMLAGGIAALAAAAGGALALLRRRSAA